MRYNSRVDGGALQSRRFLPAQASSVRTARRTVRAWLTDAGLEELADDAELAVSEVVTNALVHAGTPVELSALIGVGFARIEVADGSTHLPRTRDYDTTSGTGRGLKLLAEAVRRWGAELRGDGKIVWFEVGNVVDLPLDEGVAAPSAPDWDVVVVELLEVPLLLVSAWLEHAGELLREHLLMSLDDDPATALELHATASEALALLEEQWPELDLGLSPDELLAGAVEPLVTADRLDLAVPRLQVPAFATLDGLIEEVLEPADRGATLTPPTQPEIRQMRRWLTGQVRTQASGADPEPLRIYGDDMAPTREPVEWDHAAVDDSLGCRVAVDDTDRIVAASDAALELLGYRRAELLGRRLIAIIPARYHQAHLAGFTLHLINGRAPLIGVPVTVPVQRSNGAEQRVELVVHARVLPRGRTLFVADLRAV